MRSTDLGIIFSDSPPFCLIVTSSVSTFYPSPLFCRRHLWIAPPHKKVVIGKACHSSVESIGWGAYVSEPKSLGVRFLGLLRGGGGLFGTLQGRARPPAPPCAHVSWGAQTKRQFTGK